MKDVFITESAKQTQKIAAKLSREIFPPKADQPQAGKLKSNKKAIVIGLIGELGSGKTVFAKGFAEGLGLKKIITSPTFVLEKVYELPKKHRHFIHIDAYRLEKPKDLIDLGFKNLIRDPKNIILIEWADRIKNILPKNCLKIKFEHKDKNKRKIWISRRIK